MIQTKDLEMLVFDLTPEGGGERGLGKVVSFEL